MDATSPEELQQIFAMLMQLSVKALIEAMTVEQVLIEHAPQLAVHLQDARNSVRQRLQAAGSVDQMSLEHLLLLLKSLEGPVQ